MKRNIIFSALLITFTIASCTRETKTETITTTPPPEHTTVVIDTVQKEKDGTSINVSGSGVKIESKDGSKKTNVKVSGDSSSLEISRPK